MTKQQVALEDLIVSVLLAKHKMVYKKQGRELHFSLNERKMTLLQAYLKQYDLTDHVSLDEENNLAIIKQSVTLEMLVRDWTMEGVVVALDPGKLRTQTFLLWVCLFARKTERHNVVIDSELQKGPQRTLIHLFNQHMDAELLGTGSYLKIKPFSTLLLLSLNIRRPMFETAELNYLLPPRERSRMNEMLDEWKEERSIHVN